MSRRPNRLDEILSRYTVDPETGCWLFSGTINANGYPVARYDGKLRRVHRLSYQHYVGEIPNSLDLDHICHNNSGCAGGPKCLHRRCINPEHVEPADGVTNTMRGEAPSAWHKRKMACTNGHLYTPANVYTYRSPRNGRTWKQCRICKRAHDKQRKQRLANERVGSWAIHLESDFPPEVREIM